MNGATRPAATGKPGGVIVTFFPDAGFDERLATIAREFAPLLVVDNSAEAAVAARLRGACAAHGAELRLNTDNRGLAGALNQAFASMAQRGVTAVVVFDQDSTPEPGFAEALDALAARQPDAAVIGANWRDEGRPDFPARHLRAHPASPLLFQRVPASTKDLGDVSCVITSGSLFTVETWRALGGFDERLFLDLVDTDYCLRARAAGRRVAVAAGAGLRHRRGAKRPVRFLGRTWWPAFMAPVRLRYLFRNRIRLIGRHGWREPHWVGFELCHSAKIAFEIVCLEDRKVAKLGACARGIWDGLTGATGRIGAA